MPAQHREEWRWLVVERGWHLRLQSRIRGTWPAVRANFMLIGMLFIGRRCLSAGIRLLSDNVLDDCLNIEHRDAVVVQSAGIWMQGCWGLSSGTLLEFRRGCLQLCVQFAMAKRWGGSWGPGLIAWPVL
jgi:hypothetical protein